jgi:hypothetical protein
VEKVKRNTEFTRESSFFIVQGMASPNYVSFKDAMHGLFLVRSGSSVILLHETDCKADQEFR